MQKNRSKYNLNLVYAIVGVFALIIAVAGSTYAYFSASISANNKVTGNTLDVELGLDVQKVSKGTGKLVPIHDGTVSDHESQLSTAASTTNDCVDKKGYTVCHIYKVTITNNGNSDMTVDTTITLNVNGNENIKWANMSNRTTVGQVHPNSEKTIATGTPLTESGGTAELYFMVYLKNTGANQTTADSGKSFTGNITVTASTGERIQAEF